MKKQPLTSYFVILFVLCAAVIVGARMLGQQGAYLAQLYMLTPALAAMITRLFFYQPKFTDANLRFGKLGDYFKFWMISIGITALSYALFTLFGSITWDFTGQVFLNRLSEQFAAAGQDISASLPPGFTPMTMLWLFFVGGLTTFNILPGILMGFGEEFGHRGFMFPHLYKIKPWVGLLVGGLIWYAWHWPLALVIPQTAQYQLWQNILNFIVLGVGSVCTFVYLAYVYVKSKSIWVTSLAHIVLNNSAASFSYFVLIENQFLANLGLALTMAIVVIILYLKKAPEVFREYFS
ncbi:MAG: CPBP family intramembrane metalloprotease [Chloroflexi bacterium]|nr:CPBP family intramembrane metalloprotease [Chloroflexota bacterium]